jgi:integrase
LQVLASAAFMVAPNAMNTTNTEPLPDILDQGGRIVRRDVVLSEAAAAAADTTPEKALAAWLDRLAPTSRSAMRFWLGRFTAWIVGPDATIEHALRALAELGIMRAHAVLRRWVEALLNAGLATASAAAAARAVGGAVRALHEVGACPFILSRIAPRIEPRRDVRGPGRAKVVALLEHLDELAAQGDAAAARDAVAVSLLHNCALRRGEVVQIRVEELHAASGDSDASIVTTRKGKRSPERVTIDEMTEKRIERWLAIRGRAAGYMLTRLRDADPEQGLSGEGLRLALQRRAKELGLGVLRPHGLRHTSATKCMQALSPVETMALGGWHSHSAMSRYLDRGDETRRRALRAVML